MDCERARHHPYSRQFSNRKPDLIATSPLPGFAVLALSADYGRRSKTVDC
jgi:hypothetical protein